MQSPSGPPGSRRYRFGLFEFDAESSRLLRSGLPVKLQTQPARVLALLLEAGGQVVTREEIQRRLWPEESYGSFDTGLNTAIRKLRDALDDVPANPRFVGTLPRLGYRFLAPVERLDAPEEIPASQPASSSGPQPSPSPAAGPPASAAPGLSPARRNSVPGFRWALGGLLLGAALLALIGFIGPRFWRRAPIEPIRLALPLPPGHSVPRGPRGPKLAISPDGKEVFYIGEVQATTHVYRRQLAQPGPEQIPGTEGAQSVAIAPTGTRLAIYRGNRIWSLDLKTLAMEPLTPADWHPAPVQSFAFGFDGRLYLASTEVRQAYGERSPAWARPAAGATAPLPRQRIYRSTPGSSAWEIFGAAVAASPSRGDEFQFPTQVTAAGKLVFGAVWGPFDRAIYSRDLRTAGDTLLTRRGVGGFLTESGDLLYFWRGDLLARRADGSWPEVRPSAVLASGLPDAGWGAAHYAVSQEGTLAYLERPPMETFDLVWVDHAGKESVVPFPAGAYVPLDISSDGGQLLVGLVERSGMSSVWQLSLRSGEWKRLAEAVPDPPGGIWSPDGKWAVVTSHRGELSFPNIQMVGLDALGSPQRLIPSELGQFPMDWPSAGGPMVYIRSGVQPSGTDIGFATITFDADRGGQGTVAKVTAHRVLALPGDQTSPAISPDGNWLAFVQDEAGSESLRVCRLPECSSPVVLDSSGRQASPLWDRDSATLYFRSSGGIWETRIQPAGDSLSFASPRRLFDDRYAPPGYWTRQMVYDPASRRFLFARSRKPAEPIRQIQVILHWPKLLDSAPPASPGAGMPSAP